MSSDEPSSSSGSDTDEMEEQFEAERILKRRKVEGKREYLIKWKGYPVEDSSWWSKDDLDCDDMIARFNRSLKELKKKNKKAVTFWDDHQDADDDAKKKNRDPEEPEPGPSSTALIPWTPGGAKSKSTTNNDSEEEGKPEVEMILDRRFIKGRHEYLVKWKGSGDEHNSWAQKGDLDGSEEMVAEFDRALMKGKRMKMSWTSRSTAATPTTTSKAIKERGMVFIAATTKKEAVPKKEVEKILRKRSNVEYLIKWKGLEGAKEYTWESPEELDCPEIIAEFEQSVRKRNKRKRTEIRDPKSFIF